MRLTLGKKIVFLLVALVTAISAVTIIVSYRVVDEMTGGYYKGKADDLAATVATIVDAKNARTLAQETLAIYRTIDGADRITSEEWGTAAFDAYVANYTSLEQTPEYESLLAQLKKVQDANDVDCFYLLIVDKETELCLYLVDSSSTNPCPIGCIDPLYDSNRGVLENPALGFEAYLSDAPEYGWLVSSAAPVFDEDGSVVCYAGVDISMDVIKHQESSYFLALSGGVVGLTMLLSFLAILFVRRNIVRPINKLTVAASKYCSPESRDVTSFSNLDIHSHDEIETLYQSMVRMEKDIDRYIDSLVEARTKLQNTEIAANMLSDQARRDSLTGIRNKLAYDQEMLILERDRAEGLCEFGIAMVDLNDLKVINDVYGHDRGNIAITRLCNIICAIFMHSPVFRIGGDEFAILLRNNDYQNVENLVSRFKRVIEDLQKADSEELAPWERISAAIGYATYDPDLDSDVQSVFRRADEVMYATKRKMKGGVDPR